MVERNPVIALLLRDRLERAQSVEWFKSLKLELIETDAQIYLVTLKKQFDVIYMDPMYPIRKISFGKKRNADLTTPSRRGR